MEDEEGARPVRSTRRLPFPVGAAVGLVSLSLAALGACTPDSADPGSVSDAKSVAVGGSSASPLPPGRFQTLPQPCDAVELDMLKKLVPGAADYTGDETLTYDTDRRVGCGWHGSTSDGTVRSLGIDLERVVSYDPSTSDDQQAEFDFEQLATAASITLTPAAPPSSPSTTTTTTPPASPPEGQTPTGGTGTPTGTGTGSSEDGSPDGGPDYAPRALDTVGDTAFINDVVTTPKSTAATRNGPRRDVTLVFRTANVVVSITYTQTAPPGGIAPESPDLQKGAQQVADQLERRIKG